jgi:hypothetical protein
MEREQSLRDWDGVEYESFGLGTSNFRNSDSVCKVCEGNSRFATGMGWSTSDCVTQDLATVVRTPDEGWVYLSN